MATTLNVKNLVINKVESLEIYEYMKTNGLINENEVYIVENTNTVLYTPQSLTEEQQVQARANIGVGENDVIDTLIEADMINVIALSDNSILADENGNIFSFEEEE